MGGVKLVAPAERTFEQIGGDAGDIRIGRDVAGDLSKTLGAGVGIFERCSMEWTVLYDEYLYCLEGTLTIKTRDGALVMQAGHGLWLPAGTWVTYEAKERAKVVFAIYPVDWRERQPKA